MQKVEITNVTPSELVNLISSGVKEQLKAFSLENEANQTQNVKPHFTRKETALFFNVSLNCVNDWSKKGILKPHKVGQRTYFKRSECLEVLFSKQNVDLK